jgi:hypothetical protein
MIVYNFSSRNTIDGNIEAYTGPFIAVRFNLDERIAIQLGSNVVCVHVIHIDGIPKIVTLVSIHL